MKKSLIGSFCMVLCLAAGTPPAQAQDQPPQTPPGQNQPAGQAPPSQVPPAPTPQIQVPAGQTPAAQAPEAQAPPETPREPQAAPMPQPPPLPKRVPDVRMPGERGWFIGFGGWFPKEKPMFNKGKASDFTNPSDIQLQGSSKLTESLEFGMAVGSHNQLKFSAFQTQSSGSFTTPIDITVAGQTYVAGTYVTNSYRLRNLKLSYEFLTWPFPVESRRFRLKTLYQVQYTEARNTFNAPNLATTDSAGNQLTDSSGNALTYAGTNTHGFLLPTFGLGVSEYVSRHLRLELNATGFAIPHHTTLWDTDASVNFRLGHLELRGGAKAFHFKTSTQGDYYTRNTMASAFVGIRWFSD